MTDAWDGRPENPERDGWYWVSDANHETVALHWRADIEAWGDWPFTKPAAFAEDNSYLGPALLPAQVAAAVEAEREEIADAMAGAAQSIRDEAPVSCTTIDAADLLERVVAAIRARGPSDALADALRLARAEGMREARVIVSGHATELPAKQWTDDACVESWVDCVNALRAADAKEKGDG